jgi:DNA-binding transcriptional LysR family regulator
VNPNAISLRHLNFFVTLAQFGNFSRAAGQVAVTQPALSAAIRQTEELMGVRLFERSTHHVTLTEAGAALLPHAQRLLRTADNAFADMRSAAMRESVTVRVGVVPSAVPIVAQALAELMDEVHDIEVHLSDGISEDLVADLRKGGFDMAVCVIARPEKNLEADLLMEDEMVVLLHHRHALADQARLAWSALQDCEIVHFATGSIGELSAAALHQNSLTPSLKYTVSQIDSLYGLVRSGLAVGIMPRLYTRRFVEQGIKLVPLIRPSVKRRLMLLHRPQLRDEHPVATDFHARLLARLQAGFMR